MKNIKFLLFGIIVLVLIIASNSMASFCGGYLYYVFYQGIYGVILSTIIPIIYVFYYEKNKLKELGIKPVTIRAIIVGAVFICFSIGGQLMHKRVNMPSTQQMIYISIPLIMTTFFEEFFFRGFLQIRFEKFFGTIPSVVLSGLFFSLYHLGYPNFRRIDMLTTLFFVGIMFALSFKLSNNNLLTSYLVNLPNAILTYLLKPKMFPKFTLETAVVSFATIILVLLIFKFFIDKKRNSWLHHKNNLCI